MFASVYKDGNIVAVAGDKSFILGQNDLTYSFRTKQ